MKTWQTFWEGAEHGVQVAARCALRGSARGITFEDVVQEIALSSWMEWQAGHQHTEAFWEQKARWLVIDVLRKARRFAPMDDVALSRLTVNQTPAGTVDDVRHYLGTRLADLMLSGLNLAECAKKMNMSKATLSRIWNQLRSDAMSDKKKNPTLTIEDLTRNGNLIAFHLLADGVHVADGKAQPGAGLVLALKPGVKVGDEDAFGKAVVKVVRSSTRTRMPMPVTMVSADAKEKPSAATSTATEKDAKAKTRTRTKKPAVDDGTLSGNIKGDDFPKTIEEWRNACGGEKHCLCGCGAEVKKRFLPGHDARFKGCLLRKGTANAKSLANDFEWSAIIKWHD